MTLLINYCNSLVLLATLLLRLQMAQYYIAPLLLWIALWILESVSFPCI